MTGGQMTIDRIHLGLLREVRDEGKSILIQNAVQIRLDGSGRILIEGQSRIVDAKPCPQTVIIGLQTERAINRTQRMESAGVRFGLNFRDEIGGFRHLRLRDSGRREVAKWYRPTDVQEDRD